VLVQQVLNQLKDWGGQVPQEIAGREENVYFALPRDLRRKSEKSV
jgi:4-hydroxy-3-methylbut-2-en-1-yl diphosphate reductase